MGDFNADEINPPKWLNNEFFETVLRSYEKNNTIKVNDLKITPGSDKGDHFGSIMFRVVASYSSSSKDTTSRSMILKTIPEEEGYKKDFIEKSNIFHTEISMYSEDLPKIEQVLREYSDNTKLCAKMLYHSQTPHKVIVFEDLVELGYSCIRDRLNNVDEVKACLTKLAKLHAVSYKLAMEGDESVTKYDKALLSHPKEELPEFATGGLRRLINSIANEPDFQIYADKLEAIEPTLIAKCNELYNAYKLNKKAMMVLNHGDFHAKNVMFKFDKDKKLEDVMLVDFQVSCFAPAVIDVTYSIFMLFDEDLRNNHCEEMIHFYFSALLDTLKNIEYEGELPTLAGFYTDMYQFKEFEIWAMSTFLPFIHSFLSGIQEGEVEAIITSTDSLCGMYKNPSYRRELKLLLRKYLHKGYLG